MTPAQLPQPNPHPRRFWISETQLTALRQGHTHVSAFDKKNILMTIWDDQMCASHTPAQPTEAQQRIEQVIKELENDINRLSQRQQTQYRCGEISEAKRAIALLQAGDPK